MNYMKTEKIQANFFALSQLLIAFITIFTFTACGTSTTPTPSTDDNTDDNNGANGNVVMAIAAGSAHTIALKSDGTIWTWGYNASGQLGDGTTIDRYVPIQIAFMKDVTSIAAGSSHTIALKSDGTVWTWGGNEYGQLGDGTTTDSYVPIQVGSLTNVIAVAAGDDHTIVLKSDGTVWAWGYNYSGQLGNGSTEDSPTPVQVSGLTDVVAISGGYFHSIALKSDGTVWAWGLNYYGQLGNGTTINSTTPVQVNLLTNVTTIASGQFHVIALKNDNTVWTWGNNEYGQLGDGTTIDSLTPVQICDAGESAPCSSHLSDVTAVTTGGWSLIRVEYQDIQSYSVALKADGTVWTWGRNKYGQLGDGTTNDSAIPVQTGGFEGVSAIAAGGSHTVALKSDGTVWTWGSNEYGQLGDGTTIDSFIPIQASSLTDATDNDDGMIYSVSGTVEGLAGTLVLQNNGRDDLPIGENGSFTFTTPLTVGSPYNVTILTQPSGQKCVVENGKGRLYSANVTAVTVNCRNLFSDVKAVAAGTFHTTALKNDGSVWTWGSNVYGQLGDGTTIDRSTPLLVSNLTDVVDIAVGYFHTIALKTDGTVWTWGMNEYGQLGNGTRIDSYEPLQVNGLTDVIAVDAAYFHTVVLKNDGTVWAWGRDSFGLLGITTTETCRYSNLDCSTTPLQVTSLASVTSIAVGKLHTVALKNDGTVWAWGGNYQGKLGDGTTIDSFTPVQVCDAGEIAPCSSYLTDVTAIAAGDGHTIVLKSDGTVWAWGYNNSGQLGNGNTMSKKRGVRLNTLRRSKRYGIVFHGPETSY